MRLSIVIPAYGVERYLGRCLNSLLAQDLDPDSYEIIVVDDGSPDRSYEVAARYAARHPSVRVHRQPNGGLGSARNAGLAIARGDLVWFVDGDDHVMPDRLGTMVRIMDRRRLQVLALEHLAVPEDRHVVEEIWTPVDPDEVAVMTGLRYIAETPYTSETAMYVFQRRFLLEQGLRFTEGYFTEDVVYTATALVAAERVARMPGLVYLYVQRQDSLMHRRSADHTRRFVDWFSSMVFHLAELRDRVAADPAAPPGSAERLQLRVETLVFFLLARWVRSSLPLDELAATLDRFRSIGAYPMRDFPGTERRSYPYRPLRWVFDRPPLLRPFAAAVRGVLALRARFPGR